MKKKFRKFKMFKYFGGLAVIGLVSLGTAIEIDRLAGYSGIKQKTAQKLAQEYDGRKGEKKQENRETNVKSLERITNPKNLEAITNDPKDVSLSVKQNTNIKNIVEIKYPNPKYTKDDNFKSDTTRMTVSRLFYGESSTEINNKDYLFGVEWSFKNREKIKKKPLKEIILENNGKTWQYTCFSPKYKNYEKVKDPIGYGSKKQAKEEKAFREMVWRKCYDLAGKVLEKDTKPINKTQEKLKETTNYWVDSVKAPYWSYEHDENGNYVRDKNVLRTPLAVVELKLKKENGKPYKAYFYNLKSDL